MNLLSNISMDWLSFGVKQISSIDLNWIGEIIKFLIEGIGITSVGIIVFTLVLKTIVMPLDVFSKYKTKKQSLIMERMRPQMEKLQKQYANDKNMYSQKVMELYKKNGYSMLGICLPTIVSLIIFMVVFSQFSTYSQYANLELYRGMVDAYNNVVTEYVAGDEENGFLIAGTDSDGENAYRVDFDAFNDYYHEQYEYYDHNDTIIPYTEFKEKYDEYLKAVEDDEDTLDLEYDMMYLIKNYIRASAREAAAEYYRGNVQGFVVHNGWVGNIWYPDSMLEKEVPDFDDFVSSVSRASDMSNYEESYNEVTYNLTKEKDTYNGYFVLIILAIAMMFLSQFVSMRMQKGMNELGSVDGSGKRTNKMLLIIMPIIYGIFSFFYSAAFSIYMITNTTYSLVTSLIVNKSLNVKFRKMEERGELEKFLRKTPKGDKRGKRKA